MMGGPRPLRAPRGTRSGAHLGYTTPLGWTNVLDTATIYKLDPTDPTMPMDAYILVWTNAVIADQTAARDPVAKAGAGKTVQDWVAYLRAHPGLQVYTATSEVDPTATMRRVQPIIDTFVFDCGGCPSPGPS